MPSQKLIRQLLNTILKMKPVEPQPRVILVFTGNHAEFERWCILNDEKPVQHGGKARYVSDPRVLMGVGNTDVVYVVWGTVYERSDYFDVIDEIDRQHIPYWKSNKKGS